MAFQFREKFYPSCETKKWTKCKCFHWKHFNFIPRPAKVNNKLVVWPVCRTRLTKQLFFMHYISLSGQSYHWAIIGTRLQVIQCCKFSFKVHKMVNSTTLTEARKRAVMRMTLFYHKRRYLFQKYNQLSTKRQYKWRVLIAQVMSLYRLFCLVGFHFKFKS